MAMGQENHSNVHSEDIVALALGGIGGQAVARGETKFRARFSAVFNQGADKHTSAALGLAAAGDTAWPEEDSDLSVVRTVLSDPRRDVVINGITTRIWGTLWRG